MTPQAPSDPPLKTLELNGHRLAYTDEGAGPVLLAVHGVPGSLKDFRWLAPALEGVRFVRVDLPGFGETPLSLEPRPDVPSRAKVVVRVLEALGLEAVTVLGHSFGGPVAAHAALLAGARVKGLALLASVGHRAHRGKRQFGAWKLLSFGFRLPPIRRAMLPKLREAYVRSGFPRSMTDETLVNTLHRVAHTDLALTGRTVRAVRVPTLVAWTKDDPLVEDALSAELAGLAAPGPRLAFPEGGHNLQKTQAVELGAALSAFVRGG